MPRFLITGGAGFIGSHLADRLLAQGHEVVVLDDLSTGRRENLDPRALLLTGDVADPVALAKVARGCVGIFHLAAVASVHKYREDWRGASRTNLVGALNVFEQAVSADIPVVYASSAAVYGDNTDVPLSEDVPLAPISGYGADKLATEHHAAAMADMLGLRATGLRFFNVYGPRQDGRSPYSGVISIFLECYGKGKSATIFGDGQQSRDFIYVIDAVDAAIAAMDAADHGGALNISTAKPTDLLTLLDHLDPVFERPIKREHQSARTGDIRVSAGNGQAAQERIGFRPRVSMSDGLRATVDWYRKHGGN